MRLSDGDKVPPELLQQLVDFIRNFADHYHHAKEEDHLFPELAAYGIPVTGGPIGCMLHEHEVGRALVAEMVRTTEAYRGGDADAGRSFVQSARQYIDLLTLHIQKEDNVLFRIAETVLDEGALASLGQSFAAAEASLGGDLRAQYDRIVSELEYALTARATDLAGTR
jgi:hemerythrin-like domain-containing protein